jgi:O-antigen ligase
LYFIFYYNFDLNKNKITLVFFFSLYLIAIFISGERTAFFLLFFIILSILFFFKDLKKIITYSIISLLIFAVLSSYFNLGKQNPADRMFIKTFNQIIEVNNNEKDNNKKKILYRIYSKDHEGHIKLAIHLFNEKKLFGIGPKGFRYYCRKVNYSPEIGVCTTHPHNIFIQILSELGLVGIIFYFIAFIFILYHFFKSVFKKKFSPNFLAFYSISLGLIINLFPFIPSGNFFNNWISIILYYNIGIYLYSFKKCISK